MRRTTVAFALAGVLGTMALAGCSTAKPAADQCAFVVGNGIGDNRQVKKVLLPGEKVDNRGDDDAKYVPCNARNYIITSDTDAGDSHKLVQARTADGTQGTGEAVTTVPGTPVNLQVSAYWTLNQDRDTLKDFFAFCRKYTCYSNSAAGDNSANFASPGWNGMLRETFPFAIQRAASRVLRDFPPDVWNDPSRWPEIGKALSQPFMDEVKAASGSDKDFFCSSASYQTCEPVRFTVEDVSPVDGNVRTLLNDQINIQRQASNDIAKINAQKQVLTAQKQLAKEQSELYSEPGYAQERAYDTLLKAINACKEVGSCIIQLGGDSKGLNLQVPVR